MSGRPHLDIAADLRPLLDGIDGFISIERFTSLSNPARTPPPTTQREEPKPLPCVCIAYLIAG